MNFASTLEACFWASNSNFSFSFFRTFDRIFERSTGISNLRPESRTFDRNMIFATICKRLVPVWANFKQIWQIFNITVHGGYFQSEFRLGEDGICPDSYEKDTEFRDECMTFFTPDALVSSLDIDFSRRIFLFKYGEYS